MIELHHGDCLDIMPELEENSVDLVIADPPYNIGKADWDKIDNYVEWLGSAIIEIQRVLKDNGSFYLFHNDFMQIVDIVKWIDNNTEFVFKQFIVWNKRFEGYHNQLHALIGSENLRNYPQMAEYILFYTFQDETGLTAVKLDMNNFTSLRQYFKDYQEALGMTKMDLIEELGQRADHCFRWGSSQWDMPTKETYSTLAKLSADNKFVRREYEDLRREYEDLRYTFNNQKTHHSVWNYEIAECNGHETPKPVPVIANIIKHSSNEGDLVLDPFMGSGTTLLACKAVDRDAIGIELDEHYFEIAEKRIAAPVQKELL